MKIPKIVAGVLLALSIIATGCGNVKEEENKVEEKTEVSDVSSAENETEEKVIIGWINADTTTPSQIAKLNAAKEQAKQMNAELRVMDYQHDINKMIESIENLAASGGNAIIIQPEDTDVATETLQKVKKQYPDLVVVVQDFECGEDVTDYVVGMKDPVELGKMMGQQAGKWAKDNIDGSVKLALCDYPNIPFCTMQIDGFIEGVKEYIPDVEVIDRPSAISAPEGISAGENWLQAHPDVNLVGSFTDGGILGVYEAFKAAGHVGDDIGIFGGDGSIDGLKAVAEGSIFRGDLYSDIGLQGENSVIAAVGGARGNGPEDSYIKTEYIPVNADNVSEYLE